MEKRPSNNPIAPGRVKPARGAKTKQMKTINNKQNQSIMKKYFILAAAAIVAMAACSKVDSTNEGPQQKIAFQVASYVPMATKAETTTSFPGSGGSLWNEWATGTP